MFERFGFGRTEGAEKGNEGESVVETKVILEFMRHGKKETDPTKTDEEIRLSSEGRVQATQRGKELQPQPEVALAWGSSKKRTQETATRAIAGDRIADPDATLEDIERMIGDQLKVGKKIVEDKRLGFDLSGSSGGEMLEAFKKGEYIPYLIAKSDQRALETKDATTTTYVRQAGNIADIIARYLKVGEHFHKLASQTNDYEKFGNQLERYLGTHQGIVECFIAKVIEKKEGMEARDAFIASVGKSGFGETKGMHVEIVNKGHEQEIIVAYAIAGDHGEETKKVSCDADLIEEILRDREEFEKKISA